MLRKFQLGDEPERKYMTVRKFLAIYDRVAKHIPVSYNAALRFEYGDRRRPVASYHVERLESRGALILVHPRALVVTCKATPFERSERELHCLPRCRYQIIFVGTP
jgi:hypothetical protein